MINVSNKFRTEIQNGNRAYLEYVDITLKDGTVLNLTNEDIWTSGLTLTNSVSGMNEFNIGSVIINQCKVVINNTDDAYADYVFDDARVNVKIGLQLDDGIEKVQKGVYTVDTVKYNSGLIVLSCYDNMYLLEKKYASSLQFPATIQQVVQDICTRAGVTLLTQEITNGSTKIAKPDDTATDRSVLSACSQIACCYADFDEYGRLKLDWYDTTDVTLTDDFDFYGNGIALIDSNKSLTVEPTDYVITGVRAVVGFGDEAKTFMNGTDGYVIDLDNPFITESNGKSIIDNIGKYVVGMKFRPFNTQYLNDVTLQAGDRCCVVDYKGNRYLSYITMSTFTPYDFQALSCEALSAKRSTFAVGDSYSKVVSAAKNEADRAISNYEQTADNMTNLIANGFGMYTTKVEQSDGSTINYMHDKPTIEESSAVWKLTSTGLEVSSDGGTTWGVDTVGNALFNVITAHGIEADWIHVQDLAAFGATIGSWSITNSGLEYSWLWDDTNGGYVKKSMTIDYDGDIGGKRYMRIYTSGESLSIFATKLHLTNFSETKGITISDYGTSISGEIWLPGKTASRVAVVNADGELTTSSTCTTANLGYLNGLKENVQKRFNNVKHGTTVKTGVNGTSAQLFTLAQINSMFGTSYTAANCSSHINIVVSNGDAGACDAHFDGVSLKTGVWHCTFNKTLSNATIRINYTIYNF